MTLTIVKFYGLQNIRWWFIHSFFISLLLYLSLLFFVALISIEIHFQFFSALCNWFTVVLFLFPGFFPVCVCPIWQQWTAENSSNRTRTKAMIVRTNGRYRLRKKKINANGRKSPLNDYVSVELSRKYVGKAGKVLEKNKKKNNKRNNSNSDGQYRPVVL